MTYFNRVPWNWRTPLGYLGSVCAQYIWIHSGIFSVICIMPLIAGFCSIFQAFAVDIRETLSELDQSATDINKQFNYSRQFEIYTKLTQTAGFHSEAIK